MWVGLDKPGMIFENAFSNRLALPVWTSVIKAAEAAYTLGNASNRLPAAKKSRSAAGPGSGPPIAATTCAQTR